MTQKTADNQTISFATWLVVNGFVSHRGNIWIDTNIGANNKIYELKELLDIFKKQRGIN